MVHTDGTAPYVDGLKEICMSEDRTCVVKKFESGGTEWKVEIPIIKVKAKDLRQEKVLSITNINFRKNQTTKFKTKFNDGTTISHKVKSSPDQETKFTEYQNNLDGKFRIGDEVMCEIFDIKDYGTICCGRGWLLSPNKDSSQNSLVDCTFYTQKHSKETLEKETFFRGTIKSMRVTEKSQYEISGAYVEFIIDDPMPCVGTDEVAVKEVEQPQVNTVH
jgi:hypothetical protein